MADIYDEAGRYVKVCLTNDVEKHSKIHLNRNENG